MPSYTRIFKKNKDWLVRRAHLELFRGLGFGEYKRKELDLRLTHLKNVAEHRSSLPKTEDLMKEHQMFISP
ncbi:MAG: hypothetical protein DRG73_03500 [Deltaproteobacteria bacterium]|nr:MAG: hypothetical protein DRG73_03500 [Deltaproteobacteria bacterium]